MERPILNPPNPYLGPLRVFPGTLVKIAGRPRYNASRFAINLQTGPCMNPRDDLALHLSPCFNLSPPRVIRNSLVSSSWGPEESSGQFLFSPGQPFEIMVLCEESKFKIAINGAHYCEFSHRVSYEEVTHLTIDGDVDIERIVITDNNSMGKSAAPHAPPPVSQPFITPPQLPSSTPLYPSMPSLPTSYTTSNPTQSGGAPYPPPYPGGPPGQPGYGVPYGAPVSGANYPPNPSGPPPLSNPYPSTPYYPQGPAPHQPPHGYQQGPYQPGPYQQGPYQQPGSYAPQPGASSGQPHHSGAPKSPLDAIPSGLKTLAGLGIGAAAGAAALSMASSPFKAVKKAFKPKIFKAKGWGQASSSSNSSRSSISSRSSFSSNSS